MTKKPLGSCQKPMKRIAIRSLKIVHLWPIPFRCNRLAYWSWTMIIVQLKVSHKTCSLITTIPTRRELIIYKILLKNWTQKKHRTQSAVFHKTSWSSSQMKRKTARSIRQKTRHSTKLFLVVVAERCHRWKSLYPMTGWLMKIRLKWQRPSKGLLNLTDALFWNATTRTTREEPTKHAFMWTAQNSWNCKNNQKLYLALKFLYRTCWRFKEKGLQSLFLLGLNMLK